MNIDSTLRGHLLDDIQQAEDMAGIFEAKLKALDVWDHIQLFAYWTARLALARDRLERFGK